MSILYITTNNMSKQTNKIPEYDWKKNNRENYKRDAANEWYEGSYSNGKDQPDFKWAPTPEKIVYNVKDDEDEDEDEKKKEYRKTQEKEKERVIMQEINIVEEDLKPKGPINPETQLLLLSKLLLVSEPKKYSAVELEVKFGTRGIRQITKNDYDNVVKKLRSLYFSSSSYDGTYSLKIQSEFLDAKTGEFKSAFDFERFRVEINTLPLIEEYCKNGNLPDLMKKNSNDKVKIMRKQDIIIKEQPIRSADFNDFNFRVTYKSEESVSANSKIAQELLGNWDRTKKQFRYVNRISFTNYEYPFRIDLSIVKSSTMDKRRQLIKTYNVTDSNVFQNHETYEVEIEVINDLAKQKYKTGEELVKDLKYVTKIILSALQKTNYPVSYPEQRQTLSDYMRLIHEQEAIKNKTEYEPKARVYSSHFIGPSSTTLQLKHITPVNPDMNIPNITAPYAYCVTDKADGERHMMFINGEGKIYLINTNMDVMFTGSKTFEEKCFNTLLDGELILHNKEYEFINTFAAFDIYYIEGVNIRDKPFMQVPVSKEDDKMFDQGTRLVILKSVIQLLKAVSVVSKKFVMEQNKGLKSMISQYKNKNKDSNIVKSPMTFICKNFYPHFESTLEMERRKEKEGKEERDEKVGKEGKDFPTIFSGCKFILQRIKDGLYPYNTDGLIFTPTLFGVGGNKLHDTGPLKKITWEYSFKWKPAEFNTIDFLVTTKKGPDNSDIITPIFESGINVHDSSQLSQYKTLELRVGFDENRHGFINPCQDLLEDKIPELRNKGGENEETYKPKRFSPSDPPLPDAGLCNIMLQKDQSGNYQMFTQERQIFHENTIVEFRYDLSREGLWRWVPLRVRTDKTAEFLNGKISCNDFNTANSNWYSIHNPITEKMIATGEDIPTVVVSDDVYYNRVTSEKRTTGLRDFHNLYVKRMLIQAVSRRNGTLIDYACGQGGDFPKWISAGLGFVMGLDISKDNIENRVRGACARYLSFRKDYGTMPHALFVWGNSALNIRSGKAAFTDKGSSIIQSVFGQKALDKHLGPAVARQHAKGADGFDVSSCQFALHYMFENRDIFYNFVRNIAECTKQGGYFIGTSYDGKTVFNRLKTKTVGESIEIYNEGTKIWSITKEYDDSNGNEKFENDESSLGKKIMVYQESINQTLPEYLVNYEFFTQTMEKYGFQLVPLEEAKKRRLPDGTGMFNQLYNKMMFDLKQNPELEKDLKDAPLMQAFEKDISFLNRYFVYQKISTLDVEKLTFVILGQLPDELEYEERKTVEARKAVEEAPVIKRKAVKMKKTLVLEAATEALEETAIKETAIKETAIKETAVVPILKEKPKKPRTKKIPIVIEERTPQEPIVLEIADQGLKRTNIKTKKKKVVDFDVVEE